MALANKEAAAKRVHHGTEVDRQALNIRMPSTGAKDIEGRSIAQTGCSSPLSPDRCFVSPDFDLVSTKPGGRPGRAPGGPQKNTGNLSRGWSARSELVLRETRHRRLTVKQTCGASARTVGKITFVNRFWDHWVCDGYIHKPAPCEFSIINLEPGGLVGLLRRTSKLKAVRCTSAENMGSCCPFEDDRS